MVTNASTGGNFSMGKFQKTDLYTVSRCRTRGESEDHTSEKARKGSTLALKPRADVTRSPKQGISGPTKRTYVLKKFLKKKKKKKSSRKLIKEDEDLRQRPWVEATISCVSDKLLPNLIRNSCSDRVSFVHDRQSVFDSSVILFLPSGSWNKEQEKKRSGLTSTLSFMNTMLNGEFISCPWRRKIFLWCVYLKIYFGLSSVTILVKDKTLRTIFHL